MTRTWKTLGLTAALAVALTGGRAAAQPSDPGPATPKQDDLRQQVEQLRSDAIRSFQAAKKDIDAVKDDIARLRKDLDEVRNVRPPVQRVLGDLPPEAGSASGAGGNAQAAQEEIGELKEEIARLSKNLDDLRNAGPPAPRIAADVPPEAGAWDGRLSQAARDIDALKEQIARLRNDVDEVRAVRPPATRIATYPPAGAVAGTGAIRLANSYSAAVTIIVNGDGYTLAPGETRVLVDRPAGTFTYEVVGVQPAVRRTLASGGTFPIHVHP